MASDAVNGHNETWIAFVLMKREPHWWFAKPGLLGVKACQFITHWRTDLMNPHGPAHLQYIPGLHFFSLRWQPASTGCCRVKEGFATAVIPKFTVQSWAWIWFACIILQVASLFNAFEILMSHKMHTHNLTSQRSKNLECVVNEW